ncbi:MAG TPA: S8 family serine peptidase [Candidatus Limnocylindria bacterium]|jgi:subtilisin family serine protease|nr:S8 family serine peptidase [Candidatus Limnocylindria bacterium]
MSGMLHGRGLIGITLLLIISLVAGSRSQDAVASDGAPSTASAADLVDPLQPFIVVLNDAADPFSVANLHSLAYGIQVTHVYAHAIKGYAAGLTAAVRAAIEADPAVLFVSEDREVSLVGGSMAPGQVLSAGIDRIDADRSSARSGDGRGEINLNVAVIDTGIDLDHPDLNVVGGIDCTSGTGFDDPHVHGTHVAGTVAAIDNATGVVGVAPGARLWAVRVLNKHGFGTTKNVICGIDFVTPTRTNSDPSDDISVANMSLGGPGSDDGNCGNSNKDAFHRAVCASVAAGVTHVVAAGNSGSDFQGSTPAAYDEVLTVTAMADFDGRPGGRSPVPADCAASFAGFPTPTDDAVVFFSNFATTAADQSHTVAAPGVCVLSTFPGGGYDQISGTSMASPHVAGTVALCIAAGACAGMTPSQIRAKIVSDSETYSLSHPDYGFEGDPLRPVSGKYYGFLVRAGLY